MNQELNFHSLDNNLVIRGGCDLFTTKPIASDRKLFKTIDKHLQQIIQDNELSHSIEKSRERQQSVNSILGSSASPPSNFGQYHPQQQPSPQQSPLQLPIGSSRNNERRVSTGLAQFSRGSFSSHTPALSSSLNVTTVGGADDDDDTSMENSAINDSPFGPLNDVTTKKTFSYLISILNTTFSDHDFSNLQPTEENFHKLSSPEDFINRFNNIMVSLGKKQDLLNWIWDTINVYMDIIPPKSSNYGSRHNSFSHNGNSVTKPTFASPRTNDNNHFLQFDGCKIYEFQPSDQSILEDLNYPYQTLWSYYWFIYNKKKKRVAFIYLNAINKMHYSMVNRNRTSSMSRRNGNSNSKDDEGEDEDDVSLDEDEIYLNEYDDDAIVDEDSDDMDKDVVGDIEI